MLVEAPPPTVTIGSRNPHESVKKRKQAFYLFEVASLEINVEKDPKLSVLLKNRSKSI